LERVDVEVRRRLLCAIGEQGGRATEYLPPSRIRFGAPRWWPRLSSSTMRALMQRRAFGAAEAPAAARAALDDDGRRVRAPVRRWFGGPEHPRGRGASSLR